MKNFNTEEYFTRLNFLREKIKKHQKEEKILVSEIMEQFGSDLKLALKNKKEPFGKAIVKDGEFDIVYNVQKKITWDQNILADLYKKIQEHEDPSPFIKVKYEVSETAYKSWADDIQKVFKPARTEGEGTVKIEIKKED